MTPFDSEVAAALRALELDIGERVASWLAGLDEAAGPAAGHGGIRLQPLHITCRAPFANFKNQAIVVQVPEWQVRQEPVEVALETHAAGDPAAHRLDHDANGLAWKPLATGVAGKWTRATVTASVPRLRWSPQEVVFRVPSLIMNPARLRLELPARAPGAPSPDAAAVARLEQDLLSAGRNAQARIANAVASLFQEALRDLLNLRGRTLAAIDAVSRGAAGDLAASAEDGSQEPHRPHGAASHADARQAVIAAFAHEAEALERQAVQLVSDTLEGLALRVMDVADVAETHAWVVPVRHRSLGTLRLQPRLDAFDARAPDAASTPHRPPGPHPYGQEPKP